MAFLPLARWPSEADDGPMLHPIQLEYLVEERHRELRQLAATRPRAPRVVGPWRAALGRRLIATGLRLCLPPVAAKPDLCADL